MLALSYPRLRAGWLIEAQNTPSVPLLPRATKSISPSLISRAMNELFRRDIVAMPPSILVKPAQTTQRIGHFGVIPAVRVPRL